MKKLIVATILVVGISTFAQVEKKENDAEELIDQNLEDITDLIKGLKDSLNPQIKQNAEGVALSHLIRDLIEDALFVATDSKLAK